jgi:hypothetical protein
MNINPDKINYRRATVDDIETLVEYRLRFLAERSRTGKET